MRLIKETRRYFIFALDQDLDFDISGIKAADGMIWFPRCYPENDTNEAHIVINRQHRDKSTFETIEKCIEWGKKNIEEDMFKKSFEIGNKALEITPSIWEEMTKHMTNPQNFNQDDFRIYEDWTAHNFLDRDMQRFELPYLRALNRTIVGKAKKFLDPHNWRTTGEGKYFESSMIKQTLDEAMKFVGEHPDPNFRNILQKVVDREGAIYWSKATFYIGKRYTDIIQSLDDGTAAKSSIGFRGPRAIPVKDEDDNYLWDEYKLGKGEGAETVECSSVGVESQYGAGVTKNLDENENIKEMNIEDYEYLLHHIAFNDNDEEEIHHCMLYDHIANLFIQGHLLIKDNVAYINGKKINEGIFHIITGLEETQDVSWSDEEAQENNIDIKQMKSGMTFKEKAKEW